jgi:hypothetical protein
MQRTKKAWRALRSGDFPRAPIGRRAGAVRVGVGAALA